jgi:hypothetical protein
MRVRRAALAEALLLLALVGTAIGSPWRSRVLPAPAADGLPYPYCRPDVEAPPPSPTPWPALPPAYSTYGDIAAGPYPYAGAIAFGSLQAWEKTALKEAGGGWETWATVSLSRVLWVTPYPQTPGEERLQGLEPGTYRMSLGWTRSPAPLPGSPPVGPLLFGLSAVGEDGTLTGFVAAVEGSSLTLLSGDPLLDKRGSLILQAFLEWSDYPLPERDPLALLLAWNQEADAYARRGLDPSLGTIEAAYERFLADVVMQRHHYPRFGTLEWWRAAPPECRNVHDAPVGVLDDLLPRDVVVRVDPAWWKGSDWALCLRIELGSLGCSLFDAAAPSEYFHFPDVLVEPGGSIRIQVASLAEGGSPSWTQRLDVGDIPWSALSGDDAILVDLELSPSVTGYEQLRADPAAVEVGVRTLTSAEVEAIGQAIVEAQASTARVDG